MDRTAGDLQTPRGSASDRRDFGEKRAIDLWLSNDFWEIAMILPGQARPGQARPGKAARGRRGLGVGQGGVGDFGDGGGAGRDGGGVVL
jgi:hypothetical protein